MGLCIELTEGQDLGIVQNLLLEIAHLPRCKKKLTTHSQQGEVARIADEWFERLLGGDLLANSSKSTDRITAVQNHGVCAQEFPVPNQR